MMKSIKNIIPIFSLITICLACENYYNKRIVFTLESINCDRSVVGQGESVNISANIAINGMVNENNVKYTWDCSEGEFNDRTQQATIWTAPSNSTGEFLIELKVNFMGNTEEGEIAIKVVRTPAGGWGSLSGNIFSSTKVPLQDIIVTTKTGESDTTDNTGFFYIEDVPQGSTGLEFSNIVYKWATEPLDRVDISGGIHEHLGDIFLYESRPPIILNYEEIPDYQSIISIEHKFSYLFKYFEIYISYDQDGADSTLINTVQPGATSVTIKEERDSAYIAMKAIPYQGVVSNFSPWTKIHFTEVIDPHANKSIIEYLSFYNASLTWEPTGYEEYYKGFRVAEENNTGFAFISPVLPVSTFQYNIETKPGMTGNYYVIAFTKSDKYNMTQPDEQKISLEVPYMKFPEGFNGKLAIEGEMPIELLWTPVSINDTWYSGYIIKKKIITETSESGWKELTIITSNITRSYIDIDVNYGEKYRYSIQSMAYPTGLGVPEFSEPDSITVDELWDQSPLAKITDPDAEMSFFEYNNFFSVTLNWQPTGYENYYKGFRIAVENEFAEMSFVSPLLSVSTFSYNIITKPGIIDNYFVIAITKSGNYNNLQPDDQKILLEVPSMNSPSGFNGKFQIIDGITIRLSWEPIATDNTWYSGYLIEKKTITNTLEYEWEELTRIGNSFTASYTDTEVDTTNIYRYKIRTVSYPSGLGNPEYSLPDSITVEYY